MPRHLGPRHPIVDYQLISGRRGGLHWRFTLYCGHQVDRPVDNERRARLEAGEALPPLAEQAHCDRCRRELWEQRVDALPDA